VDELLKDCPFAPSRIVAEEEQRALETFERPRGWTNSAVGRSSWESRSWVWYLPLHHHWVRNEVVGTNGVEVKLVVAWETEQEVVRKGEPGEV